MLLQEPPRIDVRLAGSNALRIRVGEYAPIVRHVPSYPAAFPRPAVAIIQLAAQSILGPSASPEWPAGRQRSWPPAGTSAAPPPGEDTRHRSGRAEAVESPRPWSAPDQRSADIVLEFPAAAPEPGQVILDLRPVACTRAGTHVTLPGLDTRPGWVRHHPGLP